MQRINASSQWRRTFTPIALALVSLFTALVLWVAVTDAENPRKVDMFSGGIEVRAVNIPEGLAVGSIRPSSVGLRISADESTFGRLTASDFVAEIDLAGEQRDVSEQVVTVRVVDRQGVEIVGLEPGFVTVTLEQATTRQVPVRVNRVGSLPQGFNLDSEQINPPTVTVRGAASLMQLVDSAFADVNLTGLRASIQQQYTLVARDRSGADIRGVSILPTRADIRVNVNQVETTLALTISPTLQGSVADGFSLVAVTPDPPAIAVSGPLEALQALSTVTTEPIDISSLRADLTRTVRLRLPQGLTATRDTVTVRLKIAPTPGEITLAVAPRATGVADDLRASFQTSSINVRVRGEIPLLRSIQPGSINATVSADDLPEGVHVLTPTVTGPEGLQVASVDPPQVVLVLRK